MISNMKTLCISEKVCQEKTFKGIMAIPDGNISPFPQTVTNIYRPTISQSFDFLTGGIQKKKRDA